MFNAFTEETVLLKNLKF